MAAERHLGELLQWRNTESLRNAGMIRRIDEWSTRAQNAEAALALVEEALERTESVLSLIFHHGLGTAIGQPDNPYVGERLAIVRGVLKSIRNRVPLAEALREVVAAALPAVIRLQQGAMLHGGDENPPLEEAMLVAAETLETALSRLREAGWPAHDEKGT